MMKTKYMKLIEGLNEMFSPFKSRKYIYGLQIICIPIYHARINLTF